MPVQGRDEIVVQGGILQSTQYLAFRLHGRKRRIGHGKYRRDQPELLARYQFVRGAADPVWVAVGLLELLFGAIPGRCAMCAALFIFTATRSAAQSDELAL